MLTVLATQFQPPCSPPRAARELELINNIRGKLYAKNKFYLSSVEGLVGFFCCVNNIKKAYCLYHTPMTPAKQIDLSKKRFPRGLTQPEAGYRFSMDSLLLASFSGIKNKDRVLDLGCGCGVVGLGLLLKNPDYSLTVTALDNNPEHLACAEKNKEKLGMTDMFHLIHADVGKIREYILPESFQLVVCNPPYRIPCSGRVSAHTGKKNARFETCAGLEDFIAATAFALGTGKKGCFTSLAERLPEFFSLCLQYNLIPKKMKMVHSRLDEPAHLALVEVVKNAGQTIHIQAPLILYSGRGKKTKLTKAALDFCPFLQCNNTPV